MINLDDVYPKKENIKNKVYPVAASFYAVYCKGNKKTYIKPLVNWILSNKGLNIIEEVEYVLYSV